MYFCHPLYKERCLSGRKGRFAKPLYGLKPVPRVRIPPSPLKTITFCSGCSVARLSRLVWDQEVASSNLAIPTITHQSHNLWLVLFFGDASLLERAEKQNQPGCVAALMRKQKWVIRLLQNKIIKNNLAIPTITHQSHNLWLVLFFGDASLLERAEKQNQPGYLAALMRKQKWVILLDRMKKGRSNNFENYIAANCTFC